MSQQFPNYDEQARNGLENESCNFPADPACDACGCDTNEVFYHSDLDMWLCEDCSNPDKVDQLREVQP